ncbi:MAG: hypothetical protein NZM31_08805 [Gemmatales bacterium]|nr:hypothetical protein [Gemmatales bacterium]MDW8387092.1 hypothetical protein [Gemmatales bacterium]
MGQATRIPKPSEKPRREADSSANAGPHRLIEAAGSLSLALILLPTLALALFLGILIESRHDQRTAQQLVYGSWWFLLLLLLLFVNILFAAVKKWPWKRHQIGFLITHLGLLTLISGGALTVLGGVSGRMNLVDSPAVWVERFGPQQSDRFVDASQHRITVQRADPPGHWEWEFDPGTLPWGEVPTGSEPDGLTAALHRLAQPFGGQQTFDLGEGLRLDVLGYLPQAQQVPVRSVPSHDPGAAPAVRFQLLAPDLGALPTRWSGYHDGLRRSNVGPGLVEFLARECNPQQLAEFRQPPMQRRKRGVLVVGLGTESARIEVDQATEAVPLGNSPWRVRVLEYVPDYRQPAATRPSDPAVSFEISSADGKKFGFVTLARHAGDLFPLPAYSADYRDLPELWVWYHPPDPHYGDENLRGVLQWAADAEGRLWLRSWSTRGWEGVQGPLQVGDVCRVWAGMQGRVRLVEYLPWAVPEPWFEPASEAGSETVSALRCRLRRGSQQTEFWLGQGENETTAVLLGSEAFRVAYGPLWRDLPFTVRLVRAEQRMEADREGPQASWVALTDPQRGIEERLVRVGLNEPLVHRGYRIYQGGFMALGRGPDGKPIGRAILTVTRDPGLYVKYAGSFMVACGIFVMFWMRAYFFRHVPTWRTNALGKVRSDGE